MNSIALPPKLFLRILALAVATAAATAAVDCRGGESAMICAWKRTFFGPNALATPLRGYFVPRPPGCGDPARPAVLGPDCASPVVPSPDCASRLVLDPGFASRVFLEPGTDVGLGPVGLERLGQIPNDTDFGATPVGR